MVLIFFGGFNLLKFGLLIFNFLIGLICFNDIYVFVILNMLWII